MNGVTTGNQTPEISVIARLLVLFPKHKRPATWWSRASWCRNVLESWLRLSAGARHRRWASLSPGPQPALAARAVESEDHGRPYITRGSRCRPRAALRAPDDHRRGRRVAAIRTRRPRRAAQRSRGR